MPFDFSQKSVSILKRNFCENGAENGYPLPTGSFSASASMKMQPHQQKEWPFGLHTNSFPQNFFGNYRQSSTKYSQLKFFRKSELFSNGAFSFTSRSRLSVSTPNRLLPFDRLRDRLSKHCSRWLVHLGKLGNHLSN